MENVRLASRISAQRVGARRRDEQVGITVAIDIAGRTDRKPATVIRRRADKLDTLRCGQRRKVDVANATFLAENHVGIRRRPLFSITSAPGAPTMRSSSPSPLTSPAELTDAPLAS